MFRIITEHASKGMQLSLIWLVRFRLTARKDVFTINQQLLYLCCLDINLWPTPQPRLLKTLCFCFAFQSTMCNYVPYIRKVWRGTVFMDFVCFEKKKIIPLQTSPHNKCTSFRQEVQVHHHPCCLLAPGWTLFCRLLWTKAYTQVSGSGWFCQLAPRWNWHLCCLGRSV